MNPNFPSCLTDAMKQCALGVEAEIERPVTIQLCFMGASGRKMREAERPGKSGHDECLSDRLRKPRLESLSHHPRTYMAWTSAEPGRK